MAEEIKEVKNENVETAEVKKTKTVKKTTDTKKKTTKKTTKKPAAKKKAPTKAAPKKDKEPNKPSKPKIVIPKASAAPKKDLEQIIKHDSVAVEKKEEPLDHVEILRKKREAQKKLNEEVIDKDTDLKARLLEKSQENLVEVESEPEADAETVHIESISTITEERDSLLLEKNQLLETIDMLTEEVKHKDQLLNKQDEEIKEKNDKIVVLTNSIIGKTNEVELLKEIEELKQENEALKDEIRNNKPAEEPVEEEMDSETLQEIKEDGDLLIRIKLLNERIAEKNEQIRLVEEELDKLTEADIEAHDVLEALKKIRENRRARIDLINQDLANLAEMINETKVELDEKKASNELKKQEIEDFDNTLKEKQLNYSEKEKELKVRTRLVAEYDAVSIRITVLEESYDKCLKRYNYILTQAEEEVKKLNDMENEIIQTYLKQLRETKSKENPLYQNDKEECKALVKELNRLTKAYEQIQAEEVVENVLPEVEVKENTEELDKFKKELAAVQGKLHMITVRMEERVRVENVLKTSDIDVKTYLEAFKIREFALFEIEDSNNKILEVQEYLSKATNEEEKKQGQDKLIVLENNISIAQEKVDCQNRIIAKYENSEKVIFYKQLLKSMVEVKEHEKILQKRSEELINAINELESK